MVHPNPLAQTGSPDSGCKVRLTRQQRARAGSPRGTGMPSGAVDPSGQAPPNAPQQTQQSQAEEFNPRNWSKERRNRSKESVHGHRTLSARGGEGAAVHDCRQRWAGRRQPNSRRPKPRDGHHSGRPSAGRGGGVRGPANKGVPLGGDFGRRSPSRHSRQLSGTGPRWPSRAKRVHRLPTTNPGHTRYPASTEPTSCARGSEPRRPGRRASHGWLAAVQLGRRRVGRVLRAGGLGARAFVPWCCWSSGPGCGGVEGEERACAYVSRVRPTDLYTQRNGPPP